MSAQPPAGREARHGGKKGPRLGYKKSRTGCSRCKARRVKCDEKKPCSACQRHGILCSLVTAEAAGPSGFLSGTGTTPATGSSGPGPGAVSVTSSAGTFSSVAPFTTGPNSGPIPGPPLTCRPRTGNASNPFGPSGTALASGSGSGSGSGPTFRPGSGPFVPQTSSAGNIPLTPASSDHSRSPAGFHQAFGSGIHVSNRDSRHPSAPVPHDEINFNTLPTPRHTPMAIQSLTHPTYPPPPYLEVSGPSPARLYSAPSPAWQLPLPNNFSQPSSHPLVGAAHPPTPQSRSRHPSPLRQSPMPTEAFSTPTTDPFPYLTSFIPSALANPGSSSDSDLTLQGFLSQDFELFTHYTTTTYTTLTRGVHERIWKIEVPKLAYSHAFLMHNLLSTAAYHLAYTELDEEKRKKRVNDGRNHFSLALSGMGEVLRKDGVTPENCHVVFPASTLLFIGAMCSNGPFFNPTNDREQGKTTKAPMIDEFLNIFRTVKGIGTIVSTQQDHLQKGPMGGLFNRDSCGDVFPSMERLLAQLEGFYRRVASIPYRSPGLFSPPYQYDPENQSMSSNDKENSQIILKEIKAMEAAIRIAMGNSRTPEQEVVAVWPINASGEFAEMLEDRGEPPRPRPEPPSSSSAFDFSVSPPPWYRNPIALALLGYYCCLLKESERKCWFTTDWAEAVIKEVVAELEEMAGVAPTSLFARGGSRSTTQASDMEIQRGQHDQGFSRTDRPLPVWREWVRREWLGDALWAKEWVMAEDEEELPRQTTRFPNIHVTDLPVMDTRGQQQDSPMAGTQDEQPRTPHRPGSTILWDDVTKTGTQGQQSDASEAQRQSFTRMSQETEHVNHTAAANPSASSPVREMKEAARNPSDTMAVDPPFDMEVQDQTHGRARSKIT